MTGHRIEVTCREPTAAGVRVWFRCQQVGCVDGDVYAEPGTVADAVVARLVAEHVDGSLLGGLIEADPQPAAGPR